MDILHLLAGAYPDDCGLLEVNDAQGIASGVACNSMSPEWVFQALTTDPAAFAAELGAEFVDDRRPAVVVGPTGAMTVSFGSDAPPCAAVIDWGAGAHDFLIDPTSVTRPIGEVGDEVQVLVLEQGSVQRTIATVARSDSGPDSAAIEVEVLVFPPLEFTDDSTCPPAPALARIGFSSCSTDCDANGVAGCSQGHPTYGGDCDDSGTLDACEIGDGSVVDSDSDGAPDGCERRYGDINLDDQIDGADLAALLAAWGLPDPPHGDLDGDGQVGGSDLAFLLARWGPIG